MISASWLLVWFIVYNKQLFDGELPQPTIMLGDLEHFGEYIDNTITVSSRIVSMAEAKATLLHEMVHQWQDLRGHSVDHGAHFLSWQGLIYAATNLEI